MSPSQPDPKILARSDEVPEPTAETVVSHPVYEEIGPPPPSPAEEEDSLMGQPPEEEATPFGNY